MQLINTKTRKLIPLTISWGLVASSFAFSYNNLDHSVLNSVISSPSIDSFMQQTNDNFYSHLSIKSQFEQKVTAWKKNTMFMSFAEQIVAEKNFQEIVSMGKNVVPYILEEITKEPSPLVWSLNVIFNKTISNNPNTTIEQACKLWVKAMS
jgi:hypothetical protein